MNPVFRGLAVYMVLLILFRFMGKRSLASVTTFDFVLLLIISEVTQQALIGQDYSLTAAFVLIATLMGADVILSLLKQQFKGFDRVAESIPLVLVDKGKALEQRMKKSQVDEEDILQAARLNFGLERMDQIKYAVLEKDGNISIVPFEKQQA